MATVSKKVTLQGHRIICGAVRRYVFPGRDLLRNHFFASSATKITVIGFV